MKRILFFVVLVAIALTAVACAKSSTSSTDTSNNKCTAGSSGTAIAYDTATGKWTCPSGWEAVENPAGSQTWDISNSKGVVVARYHVESDGSKTLAEIPGISFNEAKQEWTLPNQWTAISINSKVWNIFDQKNHRVAQYEIQFDGSLKIAEEDYDPSTSYL